MGKLSEKCKGVQPGCMPAFESDLERVLANERHVLDAQVIWAQSFHPRQPSWCSSFTAALGTWTGPPELLARVGGVTAVLPRHIHDLAPTVDVNGEGKWVGVLQRSRLMNVDDRQLAE